MFAFLYFKILLFLSSFPSIVLSFRLFGLFPLLISYRILSYSALLFLFCNIPYNKVLFFIFLVFYLYSALFFICLIACFVFFSPFPTCTCICLILYTSYNLTTLFVRWPPQQRGLSNGAVQHISPVLLAWQMELLADRLFGWNHVTLRTAMQRWNGKKKIQWTDWLQEMTRRSWLASSCRYKIHNNLLYSHWTHILSWHWYVTTSPIVHNQKVTSCMLQKKPYYRHFLSPWRPELRFLLGPDCSLRHWLTMWDVTRH